MTETADAKDMIATVMVTYKTKKAAERECAWWVEAEPEVNPRVIKRDGLYYVVRDWHPTDQGTSLKTINVPCDAKEYARQMGRAAHFETAMAAKYEAAIEELMRRVDRMDPADERYAEHCQRINAHTRAAVACQKRAEAYTIMSIARLAAE